MVALKVSAARIRHIADTGSSDEHELTPDSHDKELEHPMGNHHVKSYEL